MARVLVTGGAGYIGSHTTVELLQAGYQVVVADDLSNSEMSGVEGVRQITGAEVPFEKLNCLDSEAMDALFGKYHIDAVIHFAAFKAVGESVEQPLKYYRNNLDSLITLLETMRRHSVRNIVFSSSATVYGQPDTLPATELSERKPATSAYGATKQMCEDILSDAVRAHEELCGIALRYFNPIGAHPSALIGELPKGVPNNLVPFITQTAAGIRQCLSIFGNDYNTPDGTCLRDYIDIVDLAKAHVVAVGRMLEERNTERYEVFNIGTGRAVSVMELVETFQKVNGLSLNFRITDRRPGDVEAVWADTTRANSVLGWRAERTLDQTLRSAWLWEKHIRGID